MVSQGGARSHAPSSVVASSPSLLASARQRLSTISRHLQPRQELEINTPFSTERQSQPQDDIPYSPLTREPPKDIRRKNDGSDSMAKQPDHPTLLIPGPIELDDAVLQSMSHYSQSHVGPGFVATFGETLILLRRLFQTTSPASQPLVVSGSGTLGWDMVAANLTERDAGDEALVLHTGYFADSFADCFGAYGVRATQVRAPVGQRPGLDEVERALRERRYKVVTVTHVDTSTGVLSDVEGVARLVRRVSPETLVVVDGVCSVGCEELKFDEWGVDVALTASQKAIGAPAGLCIMMMSGRAMEVFNARKTPPGSYFASFKNWIPIMQAYETKKPAYFATPSPQLIHALHTSLMQTLSQPLSSRFAAHAAASARFKAHAAALGLRQLASGEECQAHGMTALWLPEGVEATELLPRVLDKGVIFAAGLHKDCKGKYFRVGHMGVSVMDEKRGDLERAMKALEEGLVEAGYKVPKQ